RAVSDVDNLAAYVAQAATQGSYGKFIMAANGSWSHAADSARRTLNGGDTLSDQFTVVTADGTQSTVTVRIHGTNDAAVVSSETQDRKSVEEGLTAAGERAGADVDNVGAHVAREARQVSYGQFSVAEDGR